jgi:hypothetical protein
MTSTYWNKFPNFTHNSHAPLLAEFSRLANLRGWAPGSKKYHKEHGRCLLSEFTFHYGDNEERLAGWQALCYEVKMRTVPDTITQCRKALKRVHVNIVDLIDARRTSRSAKKFPSRNALRQYTFSFEIPKFFPKKAAKRNGFLTALLIDMYAAEP